tara:strand:+ start:642 stop:803 length:162 start_codon:yes stop_codon:yes gene_type:complete
MGTLTEIMLSGAAIACCEFEDGKILEDMEGTNIFIFAGKIMAANDGHKNRKHR